MVACAPATGLSPEFNNTPPGYSILNSSSKARDNPGLSSWHTCHYTPPPRKSPSPLRKKLIGRTLQKNAWFATQTATLPMQNLWYMGLHRTMHETV